MSRRRSASGRWPRACRRRFRSPDRPRASPCLRGRTFARFAPSFHHRTARPTRSEISLATHDVVNRSTRLVYIDLFATDRALRDALAFNGGVADSDGLAALGQRLGSAESQELARLANRFPPQLAAFDRFGHRIDEVEFHPAWHSLMSLLIGSGVHADPWARPGRGAQLARAAKYLLFAQVENGVQCPVTMTYASVPVMQRVASRVAAVRDAWLPRLLSHDYDPRALPASAKRGLLLGMGMTEKQ